MPERITSSVLLNVDLGELSDEPEGLYAAAHAANIACGGHAGDDASMARALAACARHGTRPGAHPSFPDPENFGRKVLEMAPEHIEETVAEQCERLSRCARAAGLALVHVKPHGALYHAANRDLRLAQAVVRGAVSALGTGIILVGPPRGALAETARANGLRFWREGFADRGLRADGSLLPRDQPGALLADPARAAAQAAHLVAAGGLDTLCVHGDSPGALAIARAVRSTLDAHRSP